jgi:hypothetical protein
MGEQGKEEEARMTVYKWTAGGLSGYLDGLKGTKEGGFM